MPPFSPGRDYDGRAGGRWRYLTADANCCPCCQVERLTAGYGGNTVVQDVSFRIGSGEFVGVVGPNGAGKSTLFSCMLGLKRDYSGTIKLFDRDAKRSAKHLSRVGYVPQRPALEEGFPATVRDVVRMGARPGTDADTVLKEFWMHELADRRIGELSGGQQQRAFIARAIINRPELLILDEPSTGIDEANVAIFYSTLQKINAAGVTIVWSTHDINAIKKYSNTLLCLNRTVFYNGTTDEFFANPELVRRYAEDERRHRMYDHR